ncbi:hypothetical protein D0C36_23110 [Mucilaginibacter conchicola]|uniref:Uncharacterized protein n=1 Tax=Mucilaginibacter conchicola TaxID=2303333 RepID=A0A372NMF1_9SPHI|nr:hypothetical protein [Mucilaginibacter conchicola]RFZ90132.1 hypothetical protein D0C36_23110 [Mucilaginibacter conchicola]
MEAIRLDFTTQYNQFYLSSDNGNAALSNGIIWTEKAYDDRLGAFENFLVVFPESYGHVRGELFVLAAGNQEGESEIYDHVVEGPLNIASGVLQILDCPGSFKQLEIPLTPGQYRVKVSFSNMVGYDSDEAESNDKCTIEIWPGNDLAVKVLKSFPRK